MHPADRETIALALVNEARRPMGFSRYCRLSELEPHQYRDQLRYADAILAVFAENAQKSPEHKEQVAVRIAQERHGSHDEHPTLYAACYEGALAALRS